MGFLDKAKAAATDLAAKAETALGSTGLSSPGAAPGAGDVDKYFHDLGVLTFLELSGRPASAEDRARVMGALQDLDARGAIRSFALHTAPPPAPGMAGAVPPPPGAAAAASAPPPPGAMGSAPPAPSAPPIPPPPMGAPPVADAPPAPSAPTAPPPPPSWMQGGNV
ncbi:hypothetical protein [Actinotalea subterranea]|uniref:hypothetical protein n=1 Tax=Actinotalea subterranea TaxID=2607497 RepID=UPI00165DA474|nr:hypothetical protein [Actinotalea subterranea]